MSSGCGDVLSLEDLKTAKKHQLFEAEVITGKQGGIASGADIDYATNQVTGQTQKTLPAVLRDAGFRPASFTFDTGGTLTVGEADLAVLWPSPGGDGQYYAWHGALPKTIPAGSTPLNTGGISDLAWKPVGDITLRKDLAQPSGATMIGVSPTGTVANMFYYVTPEQFGAVGDGTLHRLSEVYATLAAAQAVYPQATSLSQSIDWAAMQKADTVARSSKCGVRCPSQKTYYFSSLDTLMLDINSSFIAGPQSDHFNGTMIKKDKPTATGTTNIGDICIVKVKRVSDTASTNGFVNGVVFQGFSLEWANVAWMSAVKGDLSVCLHLNDAIKAKVDVSVWGGEFGVYGYGCWGAVGTIRVLSCHKGIYFDPVAVTPEHPVPGGTTGSATSFDLRVEIGGCPFPMYLDKCQYSRFTGYIEVLNNTEGPIWDSANETPVAIQLGRECEGLTFDLAVEFYNGLLLLADKDNKNISTNWKFIYTYTYNNASGPHTARYTIANKYAQTEVTIPSASRAIFSFNDTGNDITVDGMNMQPSGTSFNNLEAADKYLYAALSGNRLFFNGGNVQCTSYLKVTRANKRVIDFNRNNGLADALKPAVGWFYSGSGMYEMNSWGQLTTDATGAAWLDAPTGFNLQSVVAYPVGAGGVSHAMGITAVPTATTLRFIIDSGASRTVVYKMTAELNN